MLQCVRLSVVKITLPLGCSHKIGH